MAAHLRGEDRGQSRLAQLVYQIRDQDDVVGTPVGRGSLNARPDAYRRRPHPAARALYMPAMVGATRHNPMLKSLYECLKGRGKPAKGAIIACAREAVARARRHCSTQKTERQQNKTDDCPAETGRMNETAAA